MKRKALPIIVVAITAAFTACAQHTGFHYKRKVQPVQSTGWYGIHLPSDIFKNLSEDFGDLRILKISGADTTEVPYLLKVREAEAQTESVTLKEINKSKRDGKTYVTFELPKGRTINHALFTFEEDNFDARITIEGSHDQKQWFIISEKQRIVALHKNEIQFTATDISFSPTNYHFLRTTIEGAPITFVSASFQETKIKKGYDHVVAQRWKQTDIKSSGKTIVDITFSNIEPADRLSLAIEHARDYYRTYTLDVLLDSVKTEKGYLRHYNTLQSGYLTSIKANDLVFAPTKARQLRLTIFNEDNAPLNVKTLTVSRPEIALVSELTPADDYAVFYGHSLLQRPSYDLMHFQEKVPDSLALLHLESEVVIDQEQVEEKKPLFENPLWLWSIIGVMIVTLGFFTLRMIKNK
jgi:hypothetical protein